MLNIKLQFQKNIYIQNAKNKLKDFLYTSLRVYAIFVGIRKKKKVIDRIVVRSALTFALPDAFDFDVRKRAAYHWKAENLTFPTVCGMSRYDNSK